MSWKVRLDKEVENCFDCPAWIGENFCSELRVKLRFIGKPQEPNFKMILPCDEYQCPLRVIETDKHEMDWTPVFEMKLWHDTEDPRLNHDWTDCMVGAFNHELGLYPCKSFIENSLWTGAKFNGSIWANGVQIGQVRRNKIK
jgi:hypothetical protein